VSFQFVRASNAAAAARFKSSSDGAMFIAGGSGVVDLLSQNVIRPSLLIDLTGLSNRGIDLTPQGALCVGALTTMAQLAWHENVMTDYPVLMQALLSGATPQVHHAASIGGNLLQKTRCTYYRNSGFACNKRNPGSGCDARSGFNAGHAIFGASEHCIAVHPSDLAVALLALNAEITLEGRNGKRSLPMDDLLRLPGDTPHLESSLAQDELIVSVEIPRLSRNTRSAYSKVDEHNSFSFAVVSVAAVVEIQNGLVSNARLAAGGVAPKPWRLASTEAAILHNELNEKTIENAALAAIQGAIALAHNAHKVELLKRTVTGILTQLAGHQS